MAGRIVGVRSFAEDPAGAVEGFAEREVVGGESGRPKAEIRAITVSPLSALCFFLPDFRQITGGSRQITSRSRVRSSKHLDFID